MIGGLGWLQWTKMNTIHVITFSSTYFCSNLLQYSWKKIVAVNMLYQVVDPKKKKMLYQVKDTLSSLSDKGS